MARRTGKENAAWISAGAVVSVAIIYVIIGPMYEERPTLEVSFGLEKDFPKSTLQHDGSNYYVELNWVNTGKSKGIVSVLFTGENAKIAIHENGPWDYQQLDRLRINPNDKLTSQVYVIPGENSNQFVISFQTQIDPEQPLFQSLLPIRPTILTYEKTGNGFNLIDKR